MNNLLSRISPILTVMSGVLLLLLSEQISKIYGGFSSKYILLIMFGTLNLVLAYLTGLTKPAISTYRFSKIHYLALGMLIGSLILIPFIIDLLFSKLVYVTYVKLDWVPAILGTLCIVTWEELWFRGVPLQFAAQKYSEFGACIIFGFLFAVLHIFNPAMNLLYDGFYLFVAGYSLGILFFLTKTMWAPIGAHFSNNFLEMILAQGNLGVNWTPSKAQSIGVEVLVAIILTYLFIIQNMKKNVHSTGLS